MNSQEYTSRFTLPHHEYGHIEVEIVSGGGGPKDTKMTIAHDPKNGHITMDMLTFSKIVTQATAFLKNEILLHQLNEEENVTRN
jgi:hypothetical protein